MYALRVIVEVNVVDVMSVHVMHLGMLHGLLSTASRLDVMNEPKKRITEVFEPVESCHGWIGWLFCTDLTFGG